MEYNITSNKEVHRILDQIEIPKMMKVRQIFDRTFIASEDIPAEIHRIFNEYKMHKRIEAGMRIAITAGSREISNIALILKTVVDCLKEYEAVPFIIPAMGSHGGATAEGQRKLIEDFGITEEYCGCPIISSMDTTYIGDTEDGQQVYIDTAAYQADGIFVVGRVKMHTDFRGRYESGIMKMMAIGLGKQVGAQACHRLGFGHMAANVELYGKAVLKHANVIGALAILENAFEETAELIGMDRDEIAETEPGLLKRARTRMPKILLEECDVLIVDEIGKNFSGVGMDSNVTGRHATPFSDGGLKSQRVAVLGMSEKTHLIGYGIGLADCTTKKVEREIDRESMYVNALTAGVSSPAYLPPAFDSEREAVQACIKLCVGLPESGPRIIRIANTLNLEEILVSENMADIVKQTENMEIISQGLEMTFSDEE